MEGTPPPQSSNPIHQALPGVPQPMHMQPPPGMQPMFMPGPPPQPGPPGSYYPPHMMQGQPPQGPPLPLPRYDEEYLDHLKQLNDKLMQIRQEIEMMPKNDLEQFKDQKLPLARIKKIMKSDEDVRMISAEAPILFAKACEMFIVEMTHKAYYYAKRNNRKTLQRNDIASAITDTEIYDFLLDIMPRDEMISSAKDKQLSSYQMQLLDDVMRMQQLQTTQQAQYLKQQEMLPPGMLPGIPGTESVSEQPTIGTSAAEQVQQEPRSQEDDEEDESEERKAGEPKKRVKKRA